MSARQSAREAFGSRGDGFDGYAYWGDVMSKGQEAAPPSPGHTDLMVSPEAIDAFLGANPPPADPVPTPAAIRKATPMARGLLDYFPDALKAVAQCSQIANEQHNPGEPMHWAREKSTDHADCIIRHLIDRGTVDDDGVRHATKVAWRALAMLQVEIEAARS